MLKPGLYEKVLNRELAGQLAQSEEDLAAELGSIDPAEASRVLADYVAAITRQALDGVGGSSPTKDGIRREIALANEVVAAVSRSVGASDAELGALLDGDEVDASAQQLLSLVPRANSAAEVTRSRRAGLTRPDTSVARTSLFTGSLNEPQLYTELKKEIASADRILMLVSFVKWSGLRLIMDELRAFCDRGGRLQVITTTYIGATDPKAVSELALLPGAQVRVSFDTKRTRLHAKAYAFERETGFTTAYVGSSNLSNPAMTSGCEWNVKLSKTDQPDTLAKILATFDTYWNSPEFVPYTTADEDQLVRAIERERHPGQESHGLADMPQYVFDVTPYPYQQAILDRLRAEREVHGRWHNLVVAATGTGKTVISAFDYKGFCQEHNHGRPARLLFVAHREEILSQALACFRGVLRDPNFGDLFVGGHEPESLGHLFVSIQTLNSRDLTRVMAPDYYDFVVVDEFHHAAAASYQRLLAHFTPKVLLGLTATPERADGRTVLSWFGGRIAAEIRLPEAIDRKLLCPFTYFGVTDDVDLSEVRWRRGGYDESDLENVYVFSRGVAERRARAVFSSLNRYVTNPHEVRGLGFCVSKAHARFMADQFNKLGLPSIALTGDSSEEERRAASRRLVAREVNLIFVVDIYNEGVDIPEVDTILFLRPTQSLTVFLQQLGRGLRLADGKEGLTVLDFIAKPNRSFDFESRFSALLSRTGRSMEQEVRDGFTSVPKGCYIHLERVASRYVLDNIRSSYGTRAGLVDRITQMAQDGGPVTLGAFLDHYHLDIRQVYHGGSSFSRLCVLAGVRDDFHEEDEVAMAKALARLCSVDSRRWLRFLLDLLYADDLPAWESLDGAERRMLRMFQITLWPGSLKQGTFASPLDCVRRLLASPTMASEVADVLQWQLDHLDFVDEPVDLGFACPLDLHCRYSRDQILVAFDNLDPNSVRQGVFFVRDKGVDLLLNTLNKSDKDYSPSTMYEDYSINEWLFHWQSQSTTSEASPTGQRYIHHRQMGTRVALFVREAKTDAAGTAPYTFLGLADYQSHVGSRPMSIIWRLERPIPGKFLQRTNKLAS